MEHAIAEAAASFMTNEYVVKGAQLKCTLGSAPSLLNLPLCHGFYATGHPIIHSMDNKPMVNILPFGTCPVLGGPCAPAPVGPWLNTHDKTMIADAAPGGPLYPAVTMKSFLVCALGGLIEPKISGQEYKAPGTSSTQEGKGPANTGRYEDGTKEPAGAICTPDDWVFFGIDGTGFSETAALVSDEQLGKDLLFRTGIMQNDPLLTDLHIVSRLARILYEENPDFRGCQTGEAWAIFNNCVQNGYTLQQLTTWPNLLEVFKDPVTGGRFESVAPDTNNPNWHYCLELAKKMVSVLGNPKLVVEPSQDDPNNLVTPALAKEYTKQNRINVFENWVPNPFKTLEESQDFVFSGGNFDPYKITAWLSEDYWKRNSCNDKSTGYVAIGGYYKDGNGKYIIKNGDRVPAYNVFYDYADNPPL